MTTRPLLLTLCLLCLGPVSAQAEDHGAAASALKVLTSGGTPAAAEAPSSGGRETFVVQRSETVDGLIRRRWAGWPFKDEVFRRALADLNPGTIPNAANNLLKRGSTLQLPNVDDLRRTVLQHYPAAGELVRVRVEVESEETPRSAHGNGGSDKRRWVRYP